MAKTSTGRDFRPIILGSDENAYGTARLFREAYPDVTPLLVCKHPLIPTRDSAILSLRAIPEFDNETVFVPALTEILTEQKREYGKIVVVPCSDNYARLMASHSDRFGDLVANRFADPALLDRLDTKDRFYALCDECGLPYPKTVIASPDERRTAPDGMGFSFPIVVKPENSNGYEYLHADFTGKKKVFFFRGRAEYDAVIAAMDEAGYCGNLILQEFIPGGDDAMRVVNTYSGNDGKVRFLCLGQPVLEEYAPTTLGNYAAILSRYHEAVTDAIAGFLNRIGYVGFANFDMKFDSRTGRFLLFEINSRPGRSSFFVRAAGHNMMRYLVDDAVYGKSRDEIVVNRETALWTAVPKSVLMKYVSSPALKKEIAGLWRAGRVTRTLFCPEETSLKRKLRILRYYYSACKTYKTYYFDKEALTR